MNSQHTCGLVVCGGQSSRMQKDKAFINYHEKPQVYHAYSTLQPFCAEVFISCSAGQSRQVESSFNILIDDERFQNTGPAAALLTAATHYPNRNFVMLGCDYPFLTPYEFSQFATFIDDESFAAAFFNSEAQLYEPLIAYYSKKAAKRFLEQHNSGGISLQHFLIRNNAMKYHPQDARSFKSIDTPEQEMEARALLHHLKK